MRSGLFQVLAVLTGAGANLRSISRSTEQSQDEECYHLAVTEDILLFVIVSSRVETTDHREG